MEAPAILRVLEDAQLAHKAGDFLNSLKFYEQFFDHALDDDPAALYGVRLSYCLQGWHRLAQDFPGAMMRFKDKRDECLDAYKREREPERFHDYWSICRELGETEDAIKTFSRLHQENPKSALKLSKYVWSALVNHEHWALCNELLPEPMQKLDEALAIFDESNRLCELDPQFNTSQFVQHTVDTLLNEVSGLVAVLRHGDRSDSISDLGRTFFRAVETRNHSALSKTVNAQGSFLFASQ